MATHLRACKGRKCIETGLLQTISSRNKLLEDYFAVKGIDLEIKESKEGRDIVYCKQVKELVDNLIKERNLTGNFKIKIGI